MRIRKARGGVHPKDMKYLTEKKTIERMPDVKEYRVSLHQNIGVPSSPIVSIGQYVRVGEKIGESKARLSVPVHSPVSGYVRSIIGRGGDAEIIIENDFKNIKEETVLLKEVSPLKIQEVVDEIRDKGICGLGGAMFPTHMKFEFTEFEKVGTLIVNGAECEPYLNADNRIMIEKNNEIIKIIKTLMSVFSIEKAIIAVEDNKKEAIKELKKSIKGNYGIEVVVLKSLYPQGGEKQVIKSVTGLELPLHKLPMEIGVLMINISTLYAISEGLYNGTPLIERVVTVSGHGIKDPKNLRVKIGTPIKDILDYVGIERNSTYKLIVGGPMMGISIENEETGIKKGHGGILALMEKECNEYETKACINCGACIDVCPMGLMPLRYVEMAEKGRYREMDERYSLRSCIKCGSCEYVCPTKRPLVESIYQGLQKIKEGFKDV